jgi:hypothetical protein
LPQTVAWSEELKKINEMKLIGLDCLDEYHLELEWDHVNEGQAHDFRPSLPLSLKW